jgi:hypothetical protein
MNEMVERVRAALATYEIATRGNANGEAEWSVRSTSTGHATAAGLSYAEAKKLCGEWNARAAILAMREPTEPMVNAIDARGGDPGPFVNNWYRMNDAALAE